MRELQVGELAALAAQASADGKPLVLLDVREAWEHELATLQLPDARLRHLPLSTLAVAPGEIDLLDRLQRVVCVCHHGVRSAQVAAFLQRRGFADVYNLHGGIDAWSIAVDPRVPRY